MRFVLQAQRSDQEDARALALGFAHEVVAFFVTGQAEEGQRVHGRMAFFWEAMIKTMQPFTVWRIAMLGGGQAHW